MSYTPAVFDFPAINKRDEELKAQKWEAIQGSKLPEDTWKPAPGYDAAAAPGWATYTGVDYAGVDTDYVCWSAAYNPLGLANHKATKI